MLGLFSQKYNNIQFGARCVIGVKRTTVTPTKERVSAYKYTIGLLNYVRFKNM